MHRVIEAKHLGGYGLELRFEDGRIKRVDLSECLFGEVFEPLKSVEAFATFQIDPLLGTIVWENGADFCPDFLYGHVKEAALVQAYPSRLDFPRAPRGS